jgi:hypothetical protein
VADSGELLLHGRGCQRSCWQLDPGRDVKRLHGRDQAQAGFLAPSQEIAHSAAVGAMAVRVADGAGEELQEGEGSALARGRDDCRRLVKIVTEASWFTSSPSSNR